LIVYGVVRSRMVASIEPVVKETRGRDVSNSVIRSTLRG
jgi:hypothetical protein